MNNNNTNGDPHTNRAPMRKKFKHNSRLNESIRTLHNEVSSLKSNIEDLVKQRVAGTEESKVKPIRVKETSPQDLLNTLDMLVANAGWAHLKAKKEPKVFRGTYITNEYSMLPFATFCVEVFKDISKNNRDAQLDCTISEFVTYCCTVLQLYLMSNEEVVGHCGVTMEQNLFAKQTLDELVVPEAIYVAMYSFRSFITDSGRTKVVMSPYQWENADGVAIPLEGPVNLHQVNIPGVANPVQISNIRLSAARYSLIRQGGEVIARDQLSDVRVHRHDPISAFVTEIVPRIRNGNEMLERVLNRWLNVEMFDSYDYLPRHAIVLAQQEIQGNVVWYSHFFFVSRVLQQMKLVGRTVIGIGNDDKTPFLKEGGDYMIMNNQHEISYITQDLRGKLVPAFVLQNAAAADDWLFQLNNYTYRDGGTRWHDSIVKHAYEDETGAVVAYRRYVYALFRTVQGDPGPLMDLLDAGLA